MSSRDPVIHWFRRDLRLADNPALKAAVDTGRPVIPLYVFDERASLGGASRWWLHHSLASLQASLEDAGSMLVLRKGRIEDVLDELIEETGATAVHWTRGYEPDDAEAEPALAKALEERGVACKRFGGVLLYEPEDVANKSGEPYRVFTPFWKACLARPEPEPTVAAPDTLRAPTSAPASDDLASWRLLPTRPDWAGGLRETWTPGEAGAQERLRAFLDGPIADYASQRDRPDIEGTSRLSPHLHFGEIGPRQCRHEAAAADRVGNEAKGADAFLRELGWREFSYHLLHHWPDLPEAPFRPEFADFPWRDDADQLSAWQKGRTGYPIVDAGLRELWHTGWMHNRVRMIAASFLVKDLLLPWQDGAAWFWDTLVDADLANNSASWQWVAGCGADAAPYFRVFNPVLQGKKFDPDGAYVRRWVPELAALPTEHIHAPWEASDDVLADADVRLGETYPNPIVDHAEARNEALEALETIKGD